MPYHGSITRTTVGASIAYMLVIAALLGLSMALLLGGLTLAETGACLGPVAPYVLFWNRLRPGPAPMYIFTAIMIMLCGITAVCAVLLHLPIIDIMVFVGALAGGSIPMLFDWAATYAAITAAQQLQTQPPSPTGPEPPRHPRLFIFLFFIPLLVVALFWLVFSGSRRPGRRL
ncbi:hypothetical protein ACIGPN_27990 [Streptomyces afghaniensis]|uniref:hypothetical protein n=1 Tax=Streptomyces afghaniensis TaxID=66865 RepID=UPI0037D28A5A